MKLRGRASNLAVVAAVVVVVVVAAAPAVEARVVEKIAAVVGGNVILASEVEEKAGPSLAEITRISDPAKRSARASALRREVLDRLIDDELINEQATELRLTVTPEQVDASIAEIKRQNNIDDTQLKDALRAQGMSMTTYRADLKKQLLRFRVINIAVGSKVTISDEDVRSYYDRHYKAGGANVQVRASHIFLSIPDGADAGTVEEKQALGRKLAERAATEDFAKRRPRLSRHQAGRPQVHRREAAGRGRGRHPHAAAPKRDGEADQDLSRRPAQAEPGRHQILSVGGPAASPLMRGPAPSWAPPEAVDAGAANPRLLLLGPARGARSDAAVAVRKAG